MLLIMDVYTLRWYQNDFFFLNSIVGVVRIVTVLKEFRGSNYNWDSFKE